MKRYLVLTIQIALILFLNGCENSFKPAGSHFVEIDQPDIPDATIELSVPDTSTLIVVDTNTSFTYSIDLENLIIYETLAYLDSNNIYTGEAPIGSFNIDPNLIEDGPHTLRIEITTNAGSGSLADKLGAEGFILYGEWSIFTVGNEPLDFPSIISAYPDSGMLRINWSRCNRIRFEQYQLQSFGTIFTTDNQDITSFLDSLYIGGEIEYRVNVTIAGNQFSGYRYIHDGPLPKIHTAEPLDLNTVSLAWSPCDYPANFGSYWLYSPNDVPVEFHDINDTTYVVENWPFGRALGVRILTTNLIDNGNVYNQTGDATPVWVGDSTGLEFDDIAFLPESDQLLLANSETISLVDANSMNVVLSNDISSQLIIAISNSGESILGYDDESISLFDPVSLELVENLELENIIGWTPYIYRLAVSDNGVVFVLAKEYGGSNIQYVLVIDLNLRELMDSITISGLSYPFEMKCSADGEFIAIRGKFFRFDGDTITRINGFFRAKNILFETENNRMFYGDVDQIKIYELPSLSLIQTIPYSNSTYFTLDPITGYLGFFSETNRIFTVFDLETLSPMMETPSTAYTKFFLLDNKILSSEGFMRPVFE